MDEQLASISDDDQISEEEKAEKQKASVASPFVASVTTSFPSVPPSVDQDDDESENDDPTSNGGFNQICS